MLIVSDGPGSTKLRRSGMCRTAENACVMPPRRGLDRIWLGAGYKHVAPPGLSCRAHIRRPPYLCRRHPETVHPPRCCYGGRVAHRVGDRRGQPQAFGCGLAVEPLEDAVQARTGSGGRHGQPVALVIRAGLRADLVPRDGRRGVGGSQTGGLRRPRGQQTASRNTARK